MSPQTPDDRAFFTRKGLAGLLCVSPCVVMTVLACYQFYLVLSGQLDAWKGGGFGMFSSISAMDKRRFAVALVMKDGRRDRFPLHRIRDRFRGVDEVTQLERDVLLKPTHAALERLATVLANFEWVAVERGGSGSSLPGQDAALRPALTFYPRTHAPSGVHATPVVVAEFHL
jgi:hypothetical protein